MYDRTYLVKEKNTFVRIEIKLAEKDRQNRRLCKRRPTFKGAGVLLLIRTYIFN